MPDLPNGDAANPQPLSAVRDELRDADWLLWRGGGGIGIVGRSRYRHASKIAWWDGEPWVLEMLQFRGGQAVPLSKYVSRYPGRIDVYRTNEGDRWPEYDRAGSVRVMKGFVGEPYGWRAIWNASKLHIFGLRLFYRVDMNDLHTGDKNAYCSMAGVIADRIGGGVDQVPHLADYLTEPGEIARSPFNEYFCTLVGE